MAASALCHVTGRGVVAGARELGGGAWKGRALGCEVSRRLQVPREAATRPMTTLGRDELRAGRWWER